ncbi:MAG: protein kinase [Xanthomonadales bacterium]|nr:protein kinase [Xanthomonadales bacterium]
MPTEPQPSADADALFARIADREAIDHGALATASDPALVRALALARLLEGVAEAAAETPPPPRRSEPGENARIGPYRLLRLLGEGGMGEVWLAERCDGQVEQRVAIKRVRGAARLSMLRHLLRERRILARLSHPNIARFLGADVDAGGEPYLVLEYVEGIALDRYCRERQSPLRERLRLMLAVCDAVAHAHHHLVVHRDLKPANVLVDRDGHPKLLDFGIARLLEDSGAATHTGLAAMTPRYAAPEQFAGDDVSPAIDQYALGLMLYELLSGALPAERQDGNVVRIAAALEAGDPPPASGAMTAGPVHAAEVRGDLDAIIARCLRRDPLARYASVAELAADVRRHLAGEAVLARGDALAYRLRRFIARHRLAFFGVGIALAAIVAALLGAYDQARRAQREAAAAVAARDSAEAVNRFLADLLAAPADPHRGAGTRVADVLDAAAELVAQDESLSSAQRLAIHEVLARGFDSLGQVDRAIAEAEAGLALAGDKRASRGQRLALWELISRIESLRCRAQPAATAIAALQREAAAANAVEPAADALVAGARLAECDGDHRAQLAAATQALALLGAAREPFDSYAAAAEQAARAEFSGGDAAAAERRLRAALANWPERPRLLQFRISLRHLLLQVVAARGDLGEAEAIARENLALLGPRHGTLPHPTLIATRSALAAILQERGDYAAALVEGNAALADATTLHGAESEEAMTILANRANVLKALGHFDAAEADYRKVIATLARRESGAGGVEARLINAFNLFELLNDRARFDEAKSHGDALLAEAERVLGAEHIVTLETRDALGVTALGRGDVERAETLHRAALAGKRKALGEESPYTASARLRLGLALAARGHHAEARSEIEAALATRRKVLGPNHPDTRAAERALREVGR